MTMLRSTPILALLSVLPALCAQGCLSSADTSSADAGPVEAGADPATNPNDTDSTVNITYMDDLTMHPGCSTAGLTSRLAIDGDPAGYTAAVLPGFPCAAKEYPVPPNEDVTKPIVLLVHGNSSTPNDWQTYDKDPASTPMISETLVADGYHVYAADFRYDLVNDSSDPMTGNPAKNFDHGWATPILQSLIDALIQKYPTRKLNIAGFSLGPTIIRDALRRMLRAGKNPFSHIHALHLASGANHGVSTFAAYCGSQTNPMNKTRAGLAACQLGNRDAYMATPFLTPLNGGSDSFDTPCADGNTAYGQTGVCGGNTVVYTTVVFQDPPNGPLQDEFVSQASAHLNGANNQTVTDVDPTGYFINGMFKHHYGAIRSAQGIAIAKAALESQ